MKKRDTNKYSINEYDRDPNESIVGGIKSQEKRKYWSGVFIFIGFFLIGLYYNSTYATIQKITIKGNEYISMAEITHNIGVDETDMRVLTFKSTLKERIMNIPGVESVNIHLNFRDGLVIEIKESDIIGFSKVDGKYFLLYETGLVGELEDTALIPKIQTYPSCNNFGNDLKEFCANYAKVNATIRSQFSDIYYSTEAADPKKVTIYTDDGKVLYCRLDDMTYQLNSYNNVLVEYPNMTHFDFCGEYIYMS